MRSDIVPGARFPDYQLPDHEDVPRRVSELQGDDPLTGGQALGPEAGEWLQQATLAVRAGVPLEVPRDTIQPSRRSRRSTSPR